MIGSSQAGLNLTGANSGEGRGTRHSSVLVVNARDYTSTNNEAMPESILLATRNLKPSSDNLFSQEQFDELQQRMARLQNPNSLNVATRKPLIFIPLYNKKIEMENHGDLPSVNEVPKGKKVNRTWTVPEDDEFVVGSKACRAAGYATENGFHTGHLDFLLKHLQAAFPGTDLKISPHIESKIKIWKKDYCFLSTLMARSGVGWDSQNKVVECSDEIWKQYSQGIRGMEKKKGNSWVYYDD